MKISEYKYEAKVPYWPASSVEIKETLQSTEPHPKRFQYREIKSGTLIPIRIYSKSSRKTAKESTNI